MCLPPSSISLPSYPGVKEGDTAGLREPGEWRARGAALAQPPAAEQWGTGGGKGLAWWYLSFFLILLLLLFTPRPLCLFFLSLS